VRPSALVSVALGPMLAIAVGVAVPAAAAVQNYVALGDSYSSGVGAGSYVGSSGDCERSSNAYSAVWARANTPTSYVSVACSGAKTTDVTRTQVLKLSTSTTLVSLTIGGNDEGFASIMEDCNLRGTSTCVREISAAETDAGTNLPGKLAQMFAAIAGHAPNARVVLLGYPRFYDLGHNCIGLSQTSRTKIDEGIDVLNAVLAQSAANACVTFADVGNAFDGHEICNSNRWLHSVNIFDLEESYHPTATGQSQGYYPVFTAAARG
jgi:lysophospholipase L1-like esterase